MTTSSYDLLLPNPDPDTQPWWDAVREHRLVIQACGDCATLRHPPSAVCPECGSEKRDWQQMSGRGTIYSFVVVHKPTLPQWKSRAPYNVLMVALDDAPHIRLYGDLVGEGDTAPVIGASVEAIFDDVSADDTLIRWRLVPSPGQ